MAKTRTAEAVDTGYNPPFVVRAATPEHPSEEEIYTIGDLSREFGVTLRALRFYEDKGLLSPAREGMTRLYSAQDREHLKLILKGKRLGFTLVEIDEALAELRKSYETLSRQRSRSGS